ncbi:MAG: LytR C-terminal domain-containing protein [Elusimicrobiota bacterium]|nr:LytR C-terminal domain-containing protein [Elusimicrobiota bacterium]
MHKKYNRRHLTISLVIIAAIIVFLFFSKTGIQIKKLWLGQPLMINVLFYSKGEVLAEKLDAFVVYFDGKAKLIKIMSIDPEISLEKNLSLRKTFYNTAQKNLTAAKEKFYADLDDIFEHRFSDAYRISVDYETLSEMFIVKGKLFELISKNDFANIDEKEITQLKIFEMFLNRFEQLPFLTWLSIKNNYSALDTDLSKTLFANLLLYLQFSKQPILFYDVPVSKTAAKIEPLRSEILRFLDNVFLVSQTTNVDDFTNFVEIKNASATPRAAQYTTWLLRENGIDVLDYLNSPITADETIIKDYKGNIMQAKKIAQILGVGKIIISYDSHYYYDTTVIIGADYKVKGVEIKNGKH